MSNSGRAMIEALIAGETNPAKLASLAERQIKASAENLRAALRGIVSEIGINMSRFPSAARLISWACVCLRNNESAGKRSNRLGERANWLKTTLAQCTWAAVKKKGGYLQANAKPARPQEAIMAIVAFILTAIYHMLKDGRGLGCDHFKRHSTDQQKRRLLKCLSQLGNAVERKPTRHLSRTCGTARVSLRPVLRVSFLLENRIYKHHATETIRRPSQGTGIV
jgi:hypothetical protein